MKIFARAPKKFGGRRSNNGHRLHVKYVDPQFLFIKRLNFCFSETLKSSLLGTATREAFCFFRFLSTSLVLPSITSCITSIFHPLITAPQNTTSVSIVLIFFDLTYSSVKQTGKGVKGSSKHDVKTFRFALAVFKLDFLPLSLPSSFSLPPPKPLPDLPTPLNLSSPLPSTPLPPPRS